MLSLDQGTNTGAVKNTAENTLAEIEERNASVSNVRGSFCNDKDHI